MFAHRLVTRISQTQISRCHDNLRGRRFCRVHAPEVSKKRKGGHGYMNLQNQRARKKNSSPCDKKNEINKLLSSVVMFNPVDTPLRIHHSSPDVPISPTPSNIRHRPHTRILTLSAHRPRMISDIVLPASYFPLILYHYATAATKALHEIGGTVTSEIVGMANTRTRQEREKTYP